MNFLGMGPGELVLVMLLALIIFGPGKLPEIGSNLGKAIKQFRSATNEITQELNRELNLDSVLQDPPRKPAPAPEAPKPEPVPETLPAAVVQAQVSEEKAESVEAAPSARPSITVAEPEVPSPALVEKAEASSQATQPDDVSGEPVAEASPEPAPVEVAADKPMAASEVKELVVEAAPAAEEKRADGRGE